MAVHNFQRVSSKFSQFSTECKFLFWFGFTFIEQKSCSVLMLFNVLQVFSASHTLTFFLRCAIIKNSKLFLKINWILRWFYKNP